MKQLQKLWLSAIVIAGLGGFAAIAPRVSAAEVIIHIGAEAAPAPVVYHYTYYPEEEVYYVPETRVYWWADGAEWHSGPHVPAGVVLGASMNLGVDGRDPWRHHDVIFAKFPGHKHHDRDYKHGRDEKHHDHD